MWGCGGGNGRCRKDEGNDVREMWESVLRPHTLIHFPTPPPFLSPHSFPTRQHTSPLTPYTLPHPYPHFSTPHTSFLASPHTLTHFPTPTPTPQHTSHSPHALSHSSPHIFPHSFDYVAKLPRDDVTFINLSGKSP